MRRRPSAVAGDTHWFAGGTSCTPPRMTTPQDPARRKKQKARRSKQLAQWRAKNAGKKAAAPTKAAKKRSATAAAKAATKPATKPAKAAK